MVDNENYNKKELWSNQKEIGYEINKWDKVFKNETSEICGRQPSNDTFLSAVTERNVGIG